MSDVIALRRNGQKRIPRLHSGLQRLSIEGGFKRLNEKSKIGRRWISSSSHEGRHQSHRGVQFYDGHGGNSSLASQLGPQNEQPLHGLVKHRV